MIGNYLVGNLFVFLADGNKNIFLSSFFFIGKFHGRLFFNDHII